MIGWGEAGIDAAGIRKNRLALTEFIVCHFLDPSFPILAHFWIKGGHGSPDVLFLKPTSSVSQRKITLAASSISLLFQAQLRGHG